MSEFIEYITTENDRWDLISYKHYGDAKLYEQIIKANPNVEITPTLESGIKLKIPVISNQENIKFELPPWRE